MNANQNDQTANANGVGISELLAGKLHWIRNAMCAGGMLSVTAPMKGKHIFRARMDWKGETPVLGEISTSLGGALENLDNYLMEDAADEMVKSGQV